MRAVPSSGSGLLINSVQALGTNPKSYAAWHHRGWIVVKGGADLQAELLLVKR